MNSKNLHAVRRSMLVRLALMALLVAPIAAFAFIVRDMPKSVEAIKCQNGLWQAVDIITLHVRNKGLPPEQWDDLQECFVLTNTSYGSFTFEELKAGIFIDFPKLHEALLRKDLALSEAQGTVVIRCKINGNGKLQTAEISANNRLLDSLSKIAFAK